MVIDIHAHYVPRDGQEMAAEIGKRHHLKIEKDDRGRDALTREGRLFLRPLKAEFHDLDLRRSIMDQQGVDMQALSPAGSYFFYWMAPEESLEYARWLNNALAEAVNKNSQRFVAFASVPMQDSTRAAVELERAMRRLGLRCPESAFSITTR